MSTDSFKRREKAFEAKYQQDEAIKFKVAARRNKLLGLWAADTLGYSGEEAAAYAITVVHADFEKPGDEDVLEKVLGDLTSAGKDTNAQQIRKKMDALMTTAYEEILGETLES